MSDLSVIMDQIEARALAKLGQVARQSVAASPDPIRAAIHLERWLAACASPATYVGLINDADPSGLMNLLSCSGQVADILVQNPELGAIFFEPWQPPHVSSLIQEGQRMLAVAHSTQHRLDRLRLLKQKWTLRIAYIEVNSLWEPAVILQAISDLAEAVILLTLEVSWAAFASEKGLGLSCPVEVIGFGKLGGYELNYSSDVDLAYVVDNDVEDLGAIERFCTQFGRALENQMGRGMLYRVDLRLRPYGGSGAIVNRIGAVEAYYDRYAEVWEHLALIRSRAITPSLQAEWESLRKRVAFGSARGSWQIEELVSQRAKLEKLQTGDDLKRGPGGIRDIEFLSQSLQLVHGGSLPHLGERRTLSVLPLLAKDGLLEPETATFLANAYAFLRATEHRIQLEANVQTHNVPEDHGQLSRLARSLGFMGPSEFHSYLEDMRKRVRRIYSEIMEPLVHDGKVVDGAPAPHWIGEYSSAVESIESRERISKIASNAPVLIEEIQNEPALAEQLISGEILEAFDTKAAIANAPSLAKGARLARVKVIARWVLTQNGSLGDALDEVTDAVLQTLLGGLPLECVALGSYATHDSTLSSDADLVLFCPAGVRHLDAEQAAHGFLQEIQAMRNQGYPLSVDLRLRPDGKKGMLARTYEGFHSYALTDMEPWERLACGQSRLIIGSSKALETLHEIAGGLNEESLGELLAVKCRLETELGSPGDLKHGPGGFDDLNWLVQLLTLANPSVRNLYSVTTPNRLNDLRKAGILSDEESEVLILAHRLLLQVRWWLELSGLTKDRVPEDWTRIEAAMKVDQLGLQVVASRMAVRDLYERKVTDLQGPL
ncbi:MAG: hypothetical protein JNK63_11155 [Chthonomonas sp.]|nr:hypothetical protein [Chthonomonas sp.]